MVAAVRSAPVSWGYLFVLLVTTGVLRASTTHVADRLLLESSTNLEHLARDPIRVLVGSAFWLSGVPELVLAGAALLLVVAPLERRVGSGRTVAIAAAGHVGATLLTGVGLWLAVRAGSVAHSVADARDVGPSYALFAVAACLAYLLERRLRLPYIAALVGYGVAQVVLSTTFTDFGHLISIGIGLACYPLVRHARPLDPVGAPSAQSSRPPRPELSLPPSSLEDCGSSPP